MISRRLDHLRWLGVDGIRLGPTLGSPDEDWGYDVADYCGVNPPLGTSRTAEARRGRGPRADPRCCSTLVPNHSSDQHPWFVDAPSSQASRYRDWYVGRSEARRLAPNNWNSLHPPAGPAWTLDESTGQYYLHNFCRRSPTSTGGAMTSAPSSIGSCASGSTAASPASASTLSHDRQGPAAARQPTGDRRRPLTCGCRASASVRTPADPRCTTCCGGGATPTPFDPSGSSWVRPTCSSRSCSPRSTDGATS